MVDQSSSPKTQLTEHNIKVHNANFPKEDGQYQINLILEERALAAEEASYRQTFKDLDGPEGPEVGGSVDSPAMQPKSTAEVLKLYLGRHACSETPMSRFITMSPVQDAQPWTSRSIMHEMGIGPGDLEALETRKLATKIAANHHLDKGAQEASVGSPRPSSDTLSFSQLRAIRRAPRQDVARREQQIRIRRRHRADEGKPSK